MVEIRELVNAIFENGSDGISFTPANEDMDLQISGFEYKKRYKEKKAALGNFYHILVYKVSEMGRATHCDNFVAILTDPKVYVSNLIQNNFFGVVVKQTHGSKTFVNELYQKILTAA